MFRRRSGCPAIPLAIAGIGRSIAGARQPVAVVLIAQIETLLLQLLEVSCEPVSVIVVTAQLGNLRFTQKSVVVDVVLDFFNQPAQDEGTTLMINEAPPLNFHRFIPNEALTVLSFFKSNF